MTPAPLPADGDPDLDEIERRLRTLERDLPTPHTGYDEVRAQLERAAFPRFVAWLGPRGVPTGPGALRQLEDDARVVVEQVGQTFSPRPGPADVQAVAQALAMDVGGNGPLQRFLDDPQVSEIMVNGPAQIMVERRGRLELTGVRFRDEAHLVHLIRRVAERLDRRIDFQAPCLDARLPDGSRVHAIIPPIALDGPVLTIRKYGARFHQMEDLISARTLRPEMAYYLGACVKARLNLAVGGPSASGKTTTMNVLASQIPHQERVVTIEELAELDLSQAHGHVIRLQARNENLEGQGAVSIRALVREALRMRADRIIVGEARGAEMVDVLQAMRCGHDGSMTTIHASSADDLIERAVTISLFAEVGFSERSLRRMVVDALDTLVLLSRFQNGERKVVGIVEPYHDEAGEVRFHPVFSYDHRGYDREGRPVGVFRWENPSRHQERFQRMGIALPDPVLGELP